MYEPDDDERSIWSSKYGQKPNKILERMNSAPAFPKVKRTRMQAVLTALPVLMLLVGLFYHWNKEKQQVQGSPIEASHQWLEGAYDRITPRTDKTGGKHYLWLRASERTRPIRITYEQKQWLLSENFSNGDSLTIKAAPTVEGSSVLWLIEVLAGAAAEN